ncbi:hypothetical protein N9381_08645 [Paracoccaceae bacterium]|nr:hypothetical protein [Paracoccaceae bacterium]
MATHVVENVPTSFAVTYALMNKERCMGLSDEHHVINDELSGLPMSLELSKSIDGADERSEEMITKASNKNYKWLVVSDDELSKMDAAVAIGLETIFTDYERRGVTDARHIYSIPNQNPIF